MDAKLKALKVAELKDVLSKAHVKVTRARATKADLTALILANTSAIDVYNKLYPSDDPPPPAKSVDWEADALDSPEIVVQESIQDSFNAIGEQDASEINVDRKDASAPTTSDTADAELEKRKQRAARFGIPVVEPLTRTSTKTTSTSDAERLMARTARFGAGVSSVPTQNNKKRRRFSPVDIEEAEKRRKRAERFGIPAR